MSQDKNTPNSTPKVNPQTNDISKAVNIGKLSSEKPMVEGYQPTDKLNTSAPPSNQGKDDTK
jgi:hypothetical protein